MGTRSMTYFVDADGELLFAQYSQYDGNIEGKGVDICDILTGNHKDVPDEYKGTDTSSAGTEYPILKHNGIECLALSLLKFTKKTAFNDYLMRVPKFDVNMKTDRFGFLIKLHDYSRSTGAEYEYVVYFDGNTRYYNIICTDLLWDPAKSYYDEPEMYGGPVHKLREYLYAKEKEKEEAKRKAEEEAKLKAEEIMNQPEYGKIDDVAAYCLDGVADIEMIAMPEYD